MSFHGKLFENACDSNTALKKIIIILKMTQTAFNYNSPLLRFSRVERVARDI